MSKALVKGVDLIADSIRYQYAISFQKSRSVNYETAVQLARGATKYEEIKFEKTTLHLAVFDKSESQVGRAVALLNQIDAWPHAQMFFKGRLVNIKKALYVLECFNQSVAAKNWKAYCHTVVAGPEFYEQASVLYHIEYNRQKVETLIEGIGQNMPSEIKVQRYTFPCQLLWDERLFASDHSENMVDQIQAAGVKKYCDVCPRFNAENYKKTGKPVSTPLYELR